MMNPSIYVFEIGFVGSKSKAINISVVANQISTAWLMVAERASRMGPSNVNQIKWLSSEELPAPLAGKLQQIQANAERLA
jgi:hypothetical protein